MAKHRTMLQYLEEIKASNSSAVAEAGEDPWHTPANSHKQGSLTRRALVSCGAAAASVGLISIGGNSHTALAGKYNLDQQLARVLLSHDAFTVRQLTGRLLVDPTLRVVAQMILADFPDTLSGFQQNLLQSILVLTDDSNALKALSDLLLGSRLSYKQQEVLELLRHRFIEQPAIRKLISVGNGLRKRRRTDILQSYINMVVSNNTQTLHIPESVGDPILDALIRDFANIRFSAAFANMMATLVPLMQSPEFVTLLQEQPAAVLATFVPAGTVLALLLDDDHDPLTRGAVKGLLEYLGGIAAIGAAILLAPVELTAGAVIGTGFAIGAGLAGMAVGAMNMADEIKKEDCDLDGDPGDPKEAGECT